jgi:hypothetical protein
MPIWSAHRGRAGASGNAPEPLLLTHLRHKQPHFAVMHNGALANDMVGCGPRPEG